MRQRSSTPVIVLAAVLAAFLLAVPVFAQAQSVAAKPAAVETNKNWAPPKTADGVPDLQGYWTNQTNSPLERAPGLGAKEFFTPEELAQRDKESNEAALRRAEAGETGVHY